MRPALELEPSPSPGPSEESVSVGAVVLACWMAVAVAVATTMLVTVVYAVVGKVSIATMAGINYRIAQCCVVGDWDECFNLT